MPDRVAALEAWRAVGDTLSWRRAPATVFADDPPPRGRWFPGGALNVAANCLDRHLPERADKVAFHWEGEPDERRAITYGELAYDVRRFASVLRGLGVRPGDRVALHMGLVPEAVVAMLACARLGAVHAGLPGVLPPDALEERIANICARVVITQDGAWRHGVVLPLKARIDEAVAAVSSVEHTIVVRRTGVDVAWYEGDRWWHELIADADAGPDDPAPFEAEHPLCIAHIANRRQRPTGIVHGSANYLAFASAVHSGMVSGPDEVFWFPSEIGWLPMVSHGVYGPLVCGGTSVLYEGMLDTPSHARAWKIVERYGVGVILATPSILRYLRGWAGAAAPDHELGSLRLLVHSGETADDDLLAWLGRTLPRVEVRDAWGQNELGAVVAFNEAVAGVATQLPDIGLDVVDEEGRSVADGAEGELVARHPWPGTCVGVEGDELTSLRCFTRFPGAYASGDLACRREDGTFAFLGRIDPVVSVSGQLVSLTEIEETLLEHPYVSTAIVAARADRRTSQAIVALIQPHDGADRDRLAAELGAHVHDSLGGLSRPRTIVFVDDLPTNGSQGSLRHALHELCTRRPPAAILETTASELVALAGAPDRV